MDSQMKYFSDDSYLEKPAPKEAETEEVKSLYEQYKKLSFIEQINFKSLLR